MMQMPTQIPGSTQPLSTLASLKDPKEWEQRSTQILTAIQCFVDALRSAPNLKAQPPPTTNANGLGKVKWETLCNYDGGSLLMHLKSLGVLQQVQELQQQPGEQPEPQTSRLKPDTAIPFELLLRQAHEDDERKQILQRLILPLLRNLEQCYEILDNLPQSHSIPPKSQTQPQTSRNRRKNAAPPPLGMLSLNDYTNVACLLEFAVSVSLVPCLEYPNIYLPSLPHPAAKDGNISMNGMQIHKIDKYSTLMAQKRSQNLPKSLAGRISKMALTWGTVCKAENHELLREKLLSFNAQHCHSNHTEGPITIHQTYHIYNIFQAYNEMVSVAMATGRVLLLDRFRPMLLQRHLSDVYLTLLIAERLRWYLSKIDEQVLHKSDGASVSMLMEAEKLIEKQNNQQLQSLHQSLLLSPLVFKSSLISAAAAPSSPQIIIDCREAALAYRNLLGGGASMIIAGTPQPSIPSWLRVRLGQCLTKLAHKDLQSVVEVFVAHCFGPGGGNESVANIMNDEVMTGAAARLARALCAKPTRLPNPSSLKINSNPFLEQLYTQFVEFLVVEGKGYMIGLNSTGVNDWARSRPTMAMHLTLWATISQLPIENLRSFFTSKLASGIIPSGQDESQNISASNATQSMAAIAAWLFSIPSSLDPLTKKKVLSLLLEPLPSHKGHRLTIIGQTLRLAASFSQEADDKTSNSNLIVDITEDKGEVKAFARLIEVTVAQMIHIIVSLGAPETRSGQDQYASISLELLKTLSAGTTDKEGYYFGKSDHYVENEKSLYSGTEYRRKADTARDTDLPSLIAGTESRATYLVRSIVSLSECTGKANLESNEMSETSNSAIHLLSSSLFRLVLLLHYSSNVDVIDSDKDEHKKKLSRIILECDDLVKSNNDELQIAATVVLAALCENCPPSLLLGSAQDNNGVLEMLGLIITSAALCYEEAKHSEELFATTSIVLSLLIALLELGEQKRSDIDESFFESILPSLQVLSANQAMIAPELAEMASHAMALIAARGESVNVDDDLQMPSVDVKKSRMEVVIEKLSQAERDLQSSQPPIRAKAVVSLRHIARSFVDDDNSNVKSDLNRLDISSEKVGKPAVITEISESIQSTAETTKISTAKEETALISRSLARICLNALADPESYVFLASIQTLVVISDVCPSHIMPLMGVVIAKGKVDIDVATSNSDVSSVELSLSPEQRIKATEALIFMIRRRGDGIFMYGPSLLNTMLFGSSSGQRPTLKQPGKESTHQMIQSQTHSYFVGDKNDASEDKDFNEKKIRLNTGGPVFSVEENDVLRAGAISVVCELVSVLEPTTVASYCHILVKLSTDILQLESSRPIRRAGASLAREIYACTLRELTAHNGVSTERSSTMAVAIVKSNEESMFNRLSRCVSADEFNGKTRLVDPATQSRCAEAIEIRIELEAMGTLEAAAVIAQSLEQELNDPKVQAVRRALSKTA